jgi:hypothetical protein
MGRLMSPVMPVLSLVFAVLLALEIVSTWHVSALSVGNLRTHSPICIGKPFRTFHRRLKLPMITAESSEQPVTVRGIVVDGFFSKSANFADPQTVGKLYEKVHRIVVSQTSCIRVSNRFLALFRS